MYCNYYNIDECNILIIYYLSLTSRKGGWEEAWGELLKSADPTGETNAYRVLNVTTEASDAEIRRAYKKLTVNWHPDRHDDGGKEEAQERFIEIQQAYEVLTRKMGNYNKGHE